MIMLTSWVRSEKFHDVEQLIQKQEVRITCVIDFMLKSLTVYFKRDKPYIFCEKIVKTLDKK